MYCHNVGRDLAKYCTRHENHEQDITSRGSRHAVRQGITGRGAVYEVRFILLSRPESWSQLRNDCEAANNRTSFQERGRDHASDAEYAGT